MLGAIVEDVVVYFISNRQAVPALTEVGNQLQFIALKDLARGVVWCIDDDGFGVSVKRPLQLLVIKAPAGWSELDVATSGS